MNSLKLTIASNSLQNKLKRRLVVQNLKMAWSRRFIPKFFVWHSSRDIVRMKWRYYWTGLHTEKKRSHWIKHWLKHFISYCWYDVLLQLEKLQYLDDPLLETEEGNNG